MIDLIGDIHGYSDQLEALLNKLGYKKKGRTYFHPERRVLFLGDYINKGPKIKETLEIVKAMTDQGSAIALMGNHEYNAIRNVFSIENEGMPVESNYQCEETLAAFKYNRKEFNYYVDWFKSLPLFYENKYFRAVHACWDPGHIALLRKKLSGKIPTGELIRDTTAGLRLNRVLTETLTGKDLFLPNTALFREKGIGAGARIRIKWWEDPSQMSYKNISVDRLDNLPDIPVDLSLIKNRQYYGEDEKPVFFGHYGRARYSSIIRHNLCCLDFAVANGGALAAYRMDQASRLNNEK
ncbi:MAG: metallophosphoesterase, partial [Cyclobacteriaceae bacterium]